MPTLQKQIDCKRFKLKRSTIFAKQSGVKRSSPLKTESKYSLKPLLRSS